MRILNMDHSETELLLVTRMASTFFSLTFLFQTIHSIMVLSSRLLEVQPRFAQRQSNRFKLRTSNLCSYVLSYYSLPESTILINHNIGLECQMVGYFVNFKIVIEGGNFRCPALEIWQTVVWFTHVRKLEGLVFTIQTKWRATQQIYLGLWSNGNFHLEVLWPICSQII